MGYFDYVTLLKSTLAVPDLNPECVPRIGVLLSKLLLNVGPNAPRYGFVNFAPPPLRLGMVRNCRTNFETSSSSLLLSPEEQKH